LDEPLKPLRWIAWAEFFPLQLANALVFGCFSKMEISSFELNFNELTKQMAIT
jgi:hypothetical protein